MKKGEFMSKTTRLFALMLYVNAKKQFTAKDVSLEFGISIRTAHRYLMELEAMGVPLYTESGRNGGYRVLSNRILPPIIFDEDEALAIFFSFQSLRFFKSLPFEVNIESASRKLFSQLPDDVKKQVEALESKLLFWNYKHETVTPFLKNAIQKAVQNKTIIIKYKSKSKVTKRTITPIGVYADHGKWYMPAYDCEIEETRIFRIDRILEIKDSDQNSPLPDITLHDILHLYVVKEPVHLYVSLSNEGILSCKDNPFLETSVCCNDNGIGGYIDQIIDRSDLEYVTNFFMGLGLEAEVIKPLEIRKKISETAKSIVEKYKL